MANGLPSKKQITDMCEEQIEIAYPEKFKEKNIVIMGWQELTKKDYETFTKK